MDGETPSSSDGFNKEVTLVPGSSCFDEEGDHQGDLRRRGSHEQTMMVIRTLAPG